MGQCGHLVGPHLQVRDQEVSPLGLPALQRRTPAARWTSGNCGGGGLFKISGIN